MTFNESGQSLSGPSLVEFLRGHDAAITALEKIDDALLAALPDLRLISKYGVGLDMLELDALEARGIRLGWTPGVNALSVAELALSLAIALRHRVPEGLSLVRDGGWRQVQGRQLSETTVGVIGCGNVGKQLVRLLAPFRCRVLVHDIAPDHAFYHEHGVRAASLDDLLRESDVVTLHVPLDSSTTNMINRHRLGSMRDGSVLINTARGGLIDEDALYDELASGRLAGAAVDVFSTEPPDNPRLLTLPAFIATPHIGGSTEEAVVAMGRAAIAGLSGAKLPSDYGTSLTGRRPF